MPPSPTVAALIVAAGRGTRAGLSAPKQYVELAGRSVLGRSVAAFADHRAIGDILVVIHPEDRAAYEEALGPLAARCLPPVGGGATRQASVAAGLERLAGLAKPPEQVLVHDAARPFVDRALIDRVLAALASNDGAIPALPVTDSLKRGTDGWIIEPVAREGLWRAQTPQGFRLAVLIAAHRQAHAAGIDDLTDDAEVVRRAGLGVALVEGSEANIKLTTAEDIAMARERLQPVLVPRMATGFDVHRLVPGDHVWLCGVRIPHTAALEGHSDADVGLHALTDALLGCIADGDIGVHFPPSDPRWRGAASAIFLAEAARRVRACGGIIVHCDVTLLCEAPRIGPHRDAMRRRMAEILGIDVGAVSVKATTTEGLGFTGRREGIAAQAAATVALPAA